MNQYQFFLAICAEFPSVQGLYLFYLICGGIGFALALWRWWLGLLWLLFPMSLVLLWHFLIHNEDMYHFSAHIIREFGESYFRHSHLSVITGVLLNTTGIFIRFFRPKKMVLK